MSEKPVVQAARFETADKRARDAASFAIGDIFRTDPSPKVDAPWEWFVMPTGPVDRAQQTMILKAIKTIKIMKMKFADTHDEQILILEKSLREWKEYNESIVRFFQVGWRASANEASLNTQVAHSDKTISKSSLRETMFALQNLPFRADQSGSTVDAIEGKKREIMGVCRESLAAIISRCESNARSADSALSQIYVLQSRNLAYRRQIDSTYRNLRANAESLTVVM